MDKKNMSLGTILIVLGALLFANQFLDLDLFSMERLWPMFVLIPGLIFEISFFVSGRNPGLLVPGGILTTIGLLFFFETYTNWHFAECTWPVYIFAVAVGLFQLYLFGGRQPALLIPVTILTLVSGACFAMMIFGNILTWINYSTVLPMVLILAGVFILVGRSGYQKQQ